MMKIKRINSFFIEMIFVILFFAFSSAVILGVFAEARRRNIESNNINIAIFNTQKAIENIKEDGFENAFYFLDNENITYDFHEEINKKTAILTYDTKWEPLSLTDEKYEYLTEITVTKNSDNIMEIYIITKKNTASDFTIFEIKTGVYDA